MTAVHDRHAARTGEHNASGRLIGKIPELAAIGQVQTAEVVTRFIIPVEQVDPAVFDNGSAITYTNRDGPQNLRPLLRPGAQ